MIASLALATILIADAPAPPPSDPTTRRAYEEARDASGRSSADQLRLAYWCEARGLDAERARHLALAVLADPTNAAARGLLGLVARGGRWVRPDAVAAEQADPAAAALLAEYDARRAATPYKADAQFALGAWADERGLKDQARAHFTAAVRLDPARDAAWRRLGYVKHEGRWATDAQLAAERADADAQKAADRKWRPLLERWKDQLARPTQRDEAEASLLAVTDPRAVPSVLKVFAGREADQPRAVRLLGQVDSAAASRALATLAAFSPSAEVRRAATESLRRRDPREYASLLILLMNKPIRYEVKPVAGPGSPGVLFVEGEKANLSRLYQPRSFVNPGDRVILDRFGRPVVEHVLSSWSRSKGGMPFQPQYLSGLGSSYDDFYSSINTLVGDLTTESNPALFGRWQAQSDPISLMAQSLVRTSGSVAELASKIGSIPAAQPGGAMPARQVNVESGALVLSNGFLINPRDSAQTVTAEYSVAQLRNEAVKSAQASQRQLADDVARLERQNQATRMTNDRISALLNDATGESLPSDRAAWDRWYVNRLGYAFIEGQTPENPTFVEVIPSDYQPEVAPTNIIRRGLYVSGQSCFGAGTPVRTIAGPRAIETLRVGDVVLTQSTATGALGYQPILVTHHNPPSGTFRISLGGDTIVASAFHRFWVAGRGWVMARDLKAGDPVRTLGGVVAIESVAEGGTEPVFNLDVADDADFFAGRAAALVHDNTLPDTRLVPFDLPAEAKGLAVR